jgi:hypothetical protein
VFKLLQKWVATLSGSDGEFTEMTLCEMILQVTPVNGWVSFAVAGAAVMTIAWTAVVRGTSPVSNSSASLTTIVQGHHLSSYLLANSSKNVWKYIRERVLCTGLHHAYNNCHANIVLLAVSTLLPIFGSLAISDAAQNTSEYLYPTFHSSKLLLNFFSDARQQDCPESGQSPLMNT